MVAIYKDLDAALYANLSQNRSHVLVQGKTMLNAAFSYKMSKDPSKTSLGDNLHREQLVYSPRMTECVMDPFRLDHSMDGDIGKDHKYEKSGNVGHSKDTTFEVSRKEEIFMKCSQLDGRVHEDCGLVEMNINQVTQSSLGSPPCCDTKGSDNDCSDRDSEHVGLLSN